jgi:hypothetical protein
MGKGEFLEGDWMRPPFRRNRIPAVARTSRWAGASPGPTCTTGRSANRSASAAGPVIRRSARKGTPGATPGQVCSHWFHAARRWTTQTVAAISSADSARSQPPSIHWNGQNRLAGW